MAQFLLIGRVVPEFNVETIREIIHRPDLVVYRVRDEPNHIEIPRVRLAARGIPGITE